MSSPAGWYPQLDGRQRYWDGELWTEHFAPGFQLREPTTSAGADRVSMSFPDAVKAGLTKYFDFSGRARRSEFWWFALFFWMAYFAAAALDGVFNSDPALFGLTLLGLYLPMIAVTVRPDFRSS